MFRDSKGDFAHYARSCETLWAAQSRDCVGGREGVGAGMQGRRLGTNLWMAARETESACKVHSTLNNRQSPPTHQHWNAYRMFKAANDVTRFLKHSIPEIFGSTEKGAAKAKLLAINALHGLSFQVIFDDFQKKTAMEN